MFTQKPWIAAHSVFLDNSIGKRFRENEQGRFGSTGGRFAPRVFEVLKNSGFTLLSGIGLAAVGLGVKTLVVGLGAVPVWGIFAIQPFWMLIYSAVSAGIVQGWMKKLSGFVTWSGSDLYTQDQAIEADKRYNARVLGTEIGVDETRNPNPVARYMTGDPEVRYLESLSSFYRLVAVWRAKVTGGNIDSSTDAYLVNLDHFTKSVGRYFAEEATRKSYVTSDTEKRDRYNLFGKFDPLLNPRLEVFFAEYRDSFAEAAAEKNDGKMIAILGELGLDGSATNVYRDETLEPTRGGKSTVAVNHFRELMNEKTTPILTERDIIHPILNPFVRHLPRSIMAILGILLFNPFGPTSGLSSLSFLVESAPTAISSFVISSIFPYIGLLAILMVVFSLYTIVKEIRRVPVLDGYSGWGRLRALAPLALALALLVVVGTANVEFGSQAVGFLIAAVLLSESLSLGLFNRSLIGLSIFYHLRPVANVGATRNIVLDFLHHGLFLLLSVFIGGYVYGWFFEHTEAFKAMTGFDLSVSFQLFGGMAFFMSLGVMLLHFATGVFLRAVFAWVYPANKPGSLPYQWDEIKRRSIESPKKTAVIMAGGQPGASQQFVSGSPKALMDTYDFLKNHDPRTEVFVRVLVEQAQKQGIMAEPKEWLQALFEVEQQKGTTLWNPHIQIYDTSLDADLYFGDILSDPEQRKLVEYGWRLQRHLTTLAPAGAHTFDTFVNTIDMALAAKNAGILDKQIFYFVHNQYEGHKFNKKHNPKSYADDPSKRVDEIKQRIKHVRLMRHLGAEAYMVYNATAQPSKSALMNAIYAVPENLPKIGSALILDRNASTLELKNFINDLHLIRGDENIAILVSNRNTTLTATEVGDASRSIERGHGNALSGVPDLVGTGWGNFMRVSYWDMVTAMSHSQYPLARLRPQGARAADFQRKMFGAVPLWMNQPGISEDYWAVLAETRNLVNLGKTPKAAVSRALWFKFRESYALNEWELAPNRWSSGLAQTERDPLMQRINEYGPLSYFDREQRQSAADFYHITPYAFLSLFLTPLLILWGASPFVGVAIHLFALGFILNQILTLHSLAAAIRDSGFSGFLRWFTTRARDIRLFAPRLALEAIGYFFGLFGYQSTYRFLLSGAKGMRDERQPLSKAWASQENWTQRLLFVMVVGLVLTSLNVYVFWHYLDVLNVAMMIIPLWFSTSIFLGPFVALTKPGKYISGGAGDTVIKYLGYVFSVIVWLVISGLTINSFGGSPLTFVGLAAVYLAITIGLYGWASKKPAAGTDAYTKTARAFSQFTRGNLTGYFMFIWFAMAPLYTQIGFQTIFGGSSMVYLVLTEILSFIGLWPVTWTTPFVGALAFIGFYIGASMLRFLLSIKSMLPNYEKKWKKLWDWYDAARPGLLAGGKYYELAALDALLLEIGILIQQEAYRRVDTALAEAKAILKQTGVAPPAPAPKKAAEEARKKAAAEEKRLADEHKAQARQRATQAGVPILETDSVETIDQKIAAKREADQKKATEEKRTGPSGTRAAEMRAPSPNAYTLVPSNAGARLSWWTQLFGGESPERDSLDSIAQGIQDPEFRARFRNVRQFYSSR
ncbi:MAG: hypothetical protein HYZ86_01950, partial [Candidatus Omnitrophica bacterium]|nr:hypothetical protein [Candidatus Omnitrophota bacterium]